MSMHIENVSLELGDGDQKVLALDNVSATVNAGELTAVVGPSGAGKSSLLAVCGGLRTPTSGTIAIDGTTIFTVYAVQWGTEWTIQRAQVTGNAGGDGMTLTSHYNTASISSVNKSNRNGSLRLIRDNRYAAWAASRRRKK